MSAAADPGRVWRRFLRHRVALGGAVVVALLLSAALFAPALAPQDPTLLDTSMRFLAPFADPRFPLGRSEEHTSELQSQ